MSATNIVTTVGVAAALALSCLATASAGDLKSVGSIVDQLAAPKKPKLKTRSITGGTQSTKPSATVKLRSVIGKLRSPAFGAPSTVTVTTREEREEIQKVIKADALPQLDIEIFFDYNSAKIRAKSLPDLTKLGLALRDKRLSAADFMIIGHTDASGGDNYNLTLSKKRAHAVRSFLTDTFELKGERLIAIGYGEEQLKRPDQPTAAENRRVQFVNLSN